MDVDNGRMRRPAAAGLFQRLRRLVEEANRPLRLERTAIRAVLVLLALAATIALGAVAWLTFVESNAPSARIAATDPRLAYVERVRERIQQATDDAHGKALPQGQAGSLQLRIQLNPDGKLISATVDRSSGNASLDDLALRIVRESAPFEPFPAEVRKNTNVVEITSTFNFR